MSFKKPDFGWAFFVGSGINKNMNTEITINTPNGRGILGYGGAPITYVTELGYVMLKVWYPSKSVFVNHKISDIQEIIPSEFTIIDNNEYEYDRESKPNMASLG
jgi:hypothetical protein